MFQPEALEFLRQLKENNDREWFQPRKDEYEALLRRPAMAAVEELNRVVPPDYVTDPSKSIYRIYRDTRFSPDKTPYKTHVGSLLWHKRLGKDGGAVLYFHLSAEEFLVASGLYHCPNDMLLKTRTYLSTEHKRLDRLLRGRVLKGDKLTRPPKGFDPSHAAIEYLKHKDFLLEVSEPPEVALRPDALDRLKSTVLGMVPFVEFLNVPFLRAAASRDPLLQRE